MAGGSCFDPRSREGATREGRSRPSGKGCFDPRSREGATPVGSMKMTAMPGFDPRSREGATAELDRVPAAKPVSIRAPVRERRPAPLTRIDTGCFDPRSREGATGPRMRADARHRVSIRAPVRERLPLPNVLSPHGKWRSLREHGAGRSAASGSRASEQRKSVETKCLRRRANPPSKRRVLRFRAKGQNSSGPSRSGAGFAPTCSTRRRPSAPSR